MTTKMVEDEALECRVRNHFWHPKDVRREGRTFVQVLKCRNGCGTTKEEFIDARTGEHVRHPRYIYLDYYLLKPGAKVNKGKLRLRLIKNDMERQ